MKHSPAFLKLVDDMRQHVRETDAETVMRRIRGGERFLLVDVREESEWKSGRIRGAVHMGRGIIERDIEAIVPGKETEIILYCGGGYRSVLSAANLMKMGYTNVVSMDGGWRKWTELSFPTE